MDFSDVFRFVAALAFIIGLIGLCAFLARRFGLAPGGMLQPGAPRRLALVEMKQLDQKHRLLLIRRDGKEHLILTGGDQPLLVEAGIDAPIMPEEAITPAKASPAMPAHLERIVGFMKERRA